VGGGQGESKVARGQLLPYPQIFSCRKIVQKNSSCRKIFIQNAKCGTERKPVLKEIKGQN